MMLAMLIIIQILNLFVANFSLLFALKNYQLCGYKLSFFYSEIKNNDLFFAKFFMLIFVNISLIFSSNFYINFCLIFVFLLTIFVLPIFGKKPQKNKLVFTKRFLRFFVLTNVLFILFLVLISVFIKNVNALKYLTLNFWLIAYFILMLAHIIILPLENLIKIFYIKKAQKKLKLFKNLNIIAITGSFGKTSVKNYLYQMLKTKYKVCYSPNSYNTPMGITKTILNCLNFDDEFLILEFGADHNHDIKKLCKIVKPDHAILTGVTNQHLKTFKTLSNLIKTKFELVKFAKQDGIFVFNFDNKITKNFYKNCKAKNKFLISCEQKNENNLNKNISLFAKDISCKYFETTFCLCTKNESVFCKTKLLGLSNITNILLSAQMALKFGISLNEIEKVIQNLEPVPHRLNLIENCGKFILDDSFNANPEGVKQAIEVLKTFDGKKIVITPGLVELGNKQEEENINLGKLLRQINYVFVVGKTNKNALLKGIGDFCKNVFCFENLNEATKKLQTIFFEGDCVLFLNDLPDNYV